MHILRCVVRLLAEEIVKSLMVGVILVCDRFEIVLNCACGGGTDPEMGARVDFTTQRSDRTRSPCLMQDSVE